jgi:hypothetical protein
MEPHYSLSAAHDEKEQHAEIEEPPTTLSSHMTLVAQE